MLELGGKSPNIVLPGADVASSVGPSILRFVRNSGQGCGATTRVLLPRADVDQFTEEAQSFNAVAEGWATPWDEDTDVGPLIRRDQVEFVQGYVDRAVESGASAVAQSHDTSTDKGCTSSPRCCSATSTTTPRSVRRRLFGPVGSDRALRHRRGGDRAGQPVALRPQRDRLGPDR